jgi:hypothetical protein
MKSAEERLVLSTSMLIRALFLARGGGYVFVLCANNEHRMQLMELAAEVSLTKTTRAGFKLYLAGGGQLSFETLDACHVDWRHGRPIGAHSSTHLVADRHAIETMWPWVIEEWGRDLEDPRVFGHCADCGELAQRTGHDDCKYPGRSALAGATKRDEGEAS